MTTLTDTHKCGTHKAYRLTCEQYDRLRTDASGRGQRCMESPARLVIDHDHAGGMAAVRGLVCDPCNLHLGRVDGLRIGRDELDERYLAAAWHRRHKVEYVPATATQLRNIRVDDDLWDEAKRIATDRRETLSAVMKRALVEYVIEHGGRVER